MDIGAPDPAVRLERQQLWLAYRTNRDDHYAIIHFEGVDRVSLGLPSDERLHEHPLYSQGLTAYAFFEASPVGSRRDLRRWLVTFHDDLFDVEATTATVLVTAVESVDAAGALTAMRA